MSLSVSGIVAIVAEPVLRHKDKTFHIYKIRAVAQDLSKGNKYHYYDLEIMVSLLNVKEFEKETRREEIFHLFHGVLKEWDNKLYISTFYPRDFYRLAEPLWQERKE